MALLILGLIPVGLYMTAMEYSPDKIKLYAMHKSFGLLVLWLVGLRIIWKHIVARPKPNPDHQLWERMLSKIIHIFLYIAMIGMPLSGWLMSSAGEYPVPFFGLQIPDLVGKNMDFAKLMHGTHEVLAYLLIIALGLHIVGALKHHFIDKDSTLKNMMLAQGKLVPFIISLVALLFFAGVGFLIVQKELKQSKQAEVVTAELEDIKNVEVSELSAHQWAIVSSESSVEFKGNVYGKDFTGMFPNFHGTIIFDPDNLTESSVEIFIELNEVETGDVERNNNLLGGEWFSVNEFPQAIFKSLAFEEGEEGKYIVIGNLTMRGVTMPITMPFSLEIKPDKEMGKRALMRGQVQLNRLNYDMGAGEWEDPSIVGVDIPVMVNVVAVSAR